jgi:hypothetical protein
VKFRYESQSPKRFQSCSHTQSLCVRKNGLPSIPISKRWIIRSNPAYLRALAIDGMVRTDGSPNRAPWQPKKTWMGQGKSCGSSHIA